MEDDALDVTITEEAPTWEHTSTWATPVTEETFSQVSGFGVVCTGCMVWTDKSGHDCGRSSVTPGNQPESLVFLAKRDVFEFQRRRTLWLNDIAIELASNLVVAKKVIEILQEDSEDAEVVSWKTDVGES